MTARKLVRGIGEKKTYALEVVADSDGFFLMSGETELASASEGLRGEEYLVSVQEGAHDFYVRNESEALDALEDIGLFYLAVKRGAL